MDANLLLDGGSDLSDISDSDDGRSDDVPISPGIASTPRTTPTPIKKGSKTKAETSGSPSTSAFVDEDGSKQEKNGKVKVNGGSKGKQVKGENDAKKAGERISSAPEASSSKDQATPKESASETLKDGSSVKKPVKKKPSMRGWAYIEEPIPPPEDIILEGKRNRRPVNPYGNPPQPARTERTASASEQPLEKIREAETSAISAVDGEKHESKPRKKINIKISSKKGEGSLKSGDDQAKKDDADRKGSQAFTASPVIKDDDHDSSSLDDDDGEDAGPSRKRKRPRGQFKIEEDDEADEYVEKDVVSQKLKSTTAKRSGVPHKSKKKKRKEDGTNARRVDTFAADDGSDDYKQGKDSGDEAMSGDEDDEGPSILRPKKAAHVRNATSPMPRLKRKSEGQLGDDAKTAPRHSTGNMPSRKQTSTVAGLISTYSKPASGLAAQVTPAKPTPPKAAIRKVPSINLFDNLMGFGGKSPAVRPRPSGSGVSTPQGTSPMVRPPGSLKKADEAPASGTATPTRTQSTLPKPSPLASTNGKPKPGANGEHISAAEMAIRRKEERYNNSNPRGLFDLLEGAEIMMQFESEVRELLPHDALMSKYKLYKASRTEGLSKLVDRIKETNRNHSQSQTPSHTPSQAPSSSQTPLQTTETIV